MRTAAPRMRSWRVPLPRQDCPALHFAAIALLGAGRIAGVCPDVLGRCRKVRAVQKKPSGPIVDCGGYAPQRRATGRQDMVGQRQHRMVARDPRTR